MNSFCWKQAFELESGGVLPEINLHYHTYGTLNETKDNVIWICHALTASGDVSGWWPNMVGAGLAFDTNKYFIICVNLLGSCYGSTGPLSIDPNTAKPYYHRFPFITIRDMVAAYQLLASHLNISKIKLLVGGSMGGYQALEWAILQPEFIQHLFLIATAARESAWRVAIHTAQRMAIEADATWNTAADDAGKKGLMAARAIGILTYRSADIFDEKQTDEDVNKLDNFKVSSYIRYQGNKLADRFNAYSYWIITKAMDSHNVARRRSKSMEEVLQSIQQPSIVMGVSSDILCPLYEQKFLADNMPFAHFVTIDSEYGHDGFLTETEQISKHLKSWFDPIKM